LKNHRILKGHDRILTLCEIALIRFPDKWCQLIVATVE
jgi:hypothetical protein